RDGHERRRRPRRRDPPPRAVVDDPPIRVAASCAPRRRQYDRHVAQPDKPTKNKLTAGAWEEARALVWQHRRRLALGLTTMLLHRLAGLVAPWSTKWLMDEGIGRSRWDLLPASALAGG